MLNNAFFDDSKKLIMTKNRREILTVTRFASRTKLQIYLLMISLHNLWTN